MDLEKTLEQVQLLREVLKPGIRKAKAENQKMIDIYVAQKELIEKSRHLASMVQDVINEVDYLINNHYFTNTTRIQEIMNPLIELNDELHRFN